MKERYDQYEIKYKAKVYHIIKFSDIENLYLYDSHPGGSTYDIIGSVKAMEQIINAFIVALAEKHAIIFLPIQKNPNTFNMVLTAPTIEGFRSSLWYKLKPLMNVHTKIKDYILRYQREKLLSDANDEHDNLANWQWENDTKLFKQKEFGNTIFCSYSRNNSLRYIIGIYEAIQDVRRGKGDAPWLLGFVVSDDNISEYQERR